MEILKEFIPKDWIDFTCMVIFFFMIAIWIIAACYAEKIRKENEKEKKRLDNVIEWYRKENAKLFGEIDDMEI